MDCPIRPTSITPSAIALPSDRSTLIAMNNPSREFVYKPPDVAALEAAKAMFTGDGIQNTLRAFFAAVQQGDLEELAGVGGVLAGNNNTDCMVCGMGPGNPADYVSKDGAPCLAMQTCGATLNDTMNKANTILSTQDNPDTAFVPRLQQTLDSHSATALGGLGDKYLGLEKFFAAHGVTPDSMASGMDIQVQPNLNSQGAYHADDLPNVYTIWRKVAVYCSYKDPKGRSNDLLRSCTDYVAVKNVIKGMITGIAGYRTMAVYPESIDELFVEYVDPKYVESTAPPYNAACPGYALFSLVISSVQEHVYEALQVKLDNIDANPDLIASLNKGVTNPDIQICGLKSWVENLRTTEPYDNHGTFIPETGDIAPGMIIAKVGEATPATTLYPGDKTAISVYNFPKGSTVAVRLMDSSTDPLDNPEPILTLKNFDDDGISTVNWVVPADKPLGRYYLKATGLGVTSYSQAVDVATHGTTKRHACI